MGESDTHDRVHESNYRFNLNRTVETIYANKDIMNCIDNQKKKVIGYSWIKGGYVVFRDLRNGKFISRKKALEALANSH